jgi:hypothetical protein
LETQSKNTFENSNSTKFNHKDINKHSKKGLVHDKIIIEDKMRNINERINFNHMLKTHLRKTMLGSQNTTDACNFRGNKMKLNRIYNIPLKNYLIFINILFIFS